MLVEEEGSATNSNANANASAESHAPTYARGLRDCTDDSISANDTLEPVVGRGDPLLLVLVALDPRTAPSAPLILAASAIQIEVRDAKQQLVTWPVHPIGTAPATWKLDKPAQLEWHLSPDEVAKIAPGNYTLRAQLDTSAQAADVWKGKRSSVPVSITIVDTATTRPILAARHAQLIGDVARVETLVDAILAKRAKDIEALVMKGDLLAAAGKKEDALKRYNAALAALPAGGEPPRDILEKRRKLVFDDKP